ncbi:hypothetical protein BBP40_001436 [Aspergillus hancockii]|nr:hypothetical protein BBP40_001436 [Aspergillus hancockii]
MAATEPVRLYGTVVVEQGTVDGFFEDSESTAYQDPHSNLASQSPFLLPLDRKSSLREAPVDESTNL